MRPVNLSLDDESYKIWQGFRLGTRSKFIRAVLKDARSVQEADYQKEEALAELVKARKAIKELINCVDMKGVPIQWNNGVRDYYEKISKGGD
tara:strand:+ start:893 stop:1168 length:276 start_codon:yes stop_codon:yes gene_type:complete